MNILKIELINNENTIRSNQMPYNGENGFFIALVALCDEIGVEVPIWTSKEERDLERNGYVVLSLGNEKAIIISKADI